MNETLKGCSLADVLEKLATGKIGHRAAMEWLNIESQNELVETDGSCQVISRCALRRRPALSSERSPGAPKR
jgi:hypothetical protein